MGQSKLSAAAQTRKASQVEEMQQSLMALRDKADKKTMLEQILQQQENVKVENVKLCDVLSAATGVNLHKQVWAGMQKESTLHLVLRLRGGMHDQSSGRQDFYLHVSENEEIDMLSARILRLVR